MDWSAIDSAVRLSMENGRLKLTSDLPELLQPTHVRIADFPGKTVVNVNRKNHDVISIRHDSPTLPGQTIIYSLMALGDDVRLSVDTETETFIRSVQFIQTAIPRGSVDADDKPIRLYVSLMDNITGVRSVDLKLEAASVDDLRRKFPREVTDYLQPLLAALNQGDVIFRVDRRLVWQVLSNHWTLDPAIQTRVLRLIPLLDADNYATRENAADELTKLGEPAALVVMRLSPKHWTSEQTTRLGTFLAPYKPLPAAQADKYASDTLFLLDCLYTDDTAIRAAALSQLSEMLGRPIALNTKLPHGQWMQAVQKVRRDLLPPAAATKASAPPLTTQ